MASRRRLQALVWSSASWGEGKVYCRQCTAGASVCGRSTHQRHGRHCRRQLDHLFAGAGSSPAARDSTRTYPSSARLAPAGDDAMVARWSANPSRIAVAGDCYGVRDVGWRRQRSAAKRGSASSRHQRCRLMCSAEVNTSGGVRSATALIPSGPDGRDPRLHHCRTLIRQSRDVADVRPLATHTRARSRS